MPMEMGNLGLNLCFIRIPLSLFGLSFCFILGETGIKFIEFLRHVFYVAFVCPLGDFLVALWDFIYSVLSAFVWAWVISV